VTGRSQGKPLHPQRQREAMEALSPERDVLVLHDLPQARFVVAQEAVRRFSEVSVVRVVPGR
jgi:hypothetical protein